MKDKILLTGACYVYWLLSMRHREVYPDGIKLVRPHYDLSKVKLSSPAADDVFLVIDFHGVFGERRFHDLPTLLRTYAEQCRAMYVLGHMALPVTDLVGFDHAPKHKILGFFWYFLYDKTWDPERARQWKLSRERALRSILHDFPKLKFVLYWEHDVRWWDSQGLPRDRRLFWPMKRPDGGQVEQIKAALSEERMRGFHTFPTEASYNELYEILLKDAGYSSSPPVL
ncbi:MAG TPA: hypothetical protein VMY37_30730 [Thermoguttaceae bacterium]|nr:hypothetical protein [Thermoguttaceae bacterium]